MKQDDIRTCSLFDLIFLHIHETIKAFLTPLSPHYYVCRACCEEGDTKGTLDIP